MALTDTALRNLQPQEKPYKITDIKGLYVFINRAGKYFRMDYRFDGKRKTLSFGVYPNVKLKDARQKCNDARLLLSEGIDPGKAKKDSKIFSVNDFKSVAMEWYSKTKSTWVDAHAKKVLRRLEINIFPWLGKEDIGSITAMDFLKVLKRIEDRGIIETTHRVKQTCGQIFRYAVVTGRAERDITADLKGALTPSISHNMSTIIDPVEIGGLLRAIDAYKGHFITRCAFQFAPLVFVRPGELRKAEWSEISFKESLWKIPAEKMKMKRPHIVPLSTQAIKILSEIQPYSGESKYVFPSGRTFARPMSENTILAALRRMGYGKEEMSGHGFRAMASTLLHENGWESHLIELQLAHVERNSVKGAYNHALYMEKRIKMMQWYSDYLDSLRLSTL